MDRCRVIVGHLFPQYPHRLFYRSLHSSLTAASSSSSSSASAPSSSSTSYVALNAINYLSRTALRREPSPIRELIPFLSIPGMISLGGGMPNASAFPIAGISITLKDGRTIPFTDTEVSESLQYGPTTGLPQLVSTVLSFQQSIHRPPLPNGSYSVCLTTGSQDALWKAMEMLINEGDNVLVEKYSYSGSLAYLRGLNCNLVGVEIDGHGIIPSSLIKTLESMPRSGPRRPRVLYIIPTGHNPGGSTYTVERKRAIYDIACKHDLIVLEDDPYFFLSYGADKAPEKDSDFRFPSTQSFLSLDTQGRVLRFDSFSKILSAGLRVGVVTAPNAFLERINWTQQATSLHATNVSQMMVYKLFQSLGPEGMLDHLRRVALFYARRRDVFLAAVKKHLDGLVEYNVPEAGMFVFMKIRGIDDSKALIQTKARDAKILLMPGESFHYAARPSPYVRAAFSTATDQQIDTAMERLAALLKQHKH